MSTILTNRAGGRASGAVAIAAAVLATMPLVASAGVTNDPGYTGPGQEFVVSTTGATALGAFTRARNADNSYNRGPFALGTSTLRIGQSTYDVGFGQFLGIADKGSILGNEPTLNNDRLVYNYHETGSIAGILELVDSNGLLLSGPGGTPLAARRPLDPTTANPLFINGNRYTAHSTGPFGGYSTGQNYVNNDHTQPTNPQTGQQFARVAWSDVRSEQAFAVSGTAAVNKRPTEAGYGLGRGNIGNHNFQRLRNSNVIDGGIDPSTTKLRNEALAIVPFNLVANPGTGMARLTKDDGAWLQATGRLANGANFNVATRDSGSGTRNQGGNNLGIDPTWASGERDRIALATYNNGTDPDGNTGITVNVGDEADPRLSLTGNAIADLNESRVSPTMRFADKTSGSTGIRPSVQASRMGMAGILSSGDTGDNARVAASATPLRALAVDWGNGHGFVQATARNTTEGRYEMWSSSQAITVAPYANPAANDTTAANGRPILGDQNDEAALAGGGSNIGVHRKFLDNINNSVATLSASPTNQTPVDAILAAGFIPPQIMGVTKQYDGSPQSPRTRSTVDPDGAGPQKSEQEVWDIVTAPGGSLQTSLNWLDPSSHNGNVTGGTVRYNIYAPTNTLASSNANADLSIVINGRGNLAGDMNNDGVRDLADVNDLAHALASPTSYLAAKGALTTGADSTVNDGSSLNSTGVTARAGGLLGAAPSAGIAGLIVLTDLNSDGNVRSTGPGTFTVDAVSRADVRYFLYGAAIDTAGFGATTSTLNGSVVSLTAAQNKRENGARLGQLRKNAAIDTFNVRLDVLVDNGQVGDIAGLTQAQADEMKFNKHDVDNDTFADVYDAVITDRNDGKNYTNLSHVLGTSDDLIAAELNDNNVIDAADVTVMNAGLSGVGKTHWAGGTLEKTGPHAIVISRTAGAGSEVTVPEAGQTLKISSGQFHAGGTADVFTDTATPTRHLDIVNNSAGSGGTSNVGFNVTAGDKAIGTLTGTGATSVAAGASLTTSRVRQGALHVHGAAEVRPNGGADGMTIVNALSVSPGGVLRQNDNDFIVDYGTSEASPEFALRDYVKAIYQGGTSGISYTAGDGDVALAVAERTEWGFSEFNGVALDTTTVIGKYTYFGDANLDGKVTSDDYVAVDVGLGTGDSWVQGDFNFSGTVTSDDYVAIDVNLGKGSPTPLAMEELKAEMIELHTEMFGDEYVQMLARVEAEGFSALVPEPGALSLVGLGGMSLLGRRRRKLSHR